MDTSEFKNKKNLTSENPNIGLVFKYRYKRSFGIGTLYKFGKIQTQIIKVERN